MSGFRLGSPMPDEQFWSRFDDEIDDRIAEIVEEQLRERNAARRGPRSAQLLGVACLILAVMGSGVLLGRSLQAWAIWPVAALVCVAATWVAVVSR